MEYIMHFDFKAVVIEPTNNEFIRVFRYLFVGGVATIVDWGILYIATTMGMYYLFSSVLGFIGGLVVNFMLSQVLVFKGAKAKLGVIMEFILYAVIGVMGLVFTVLVMYIVTEKIRLWYMLSKSLSTVIVLAWNYTARRMLYK